VCVFVKRFNLSLVYMFFYVARVSMKKDKLNFKGGTSLCGSIVNGHGLGVQSLGVCSDCLGHTGAIHELSFGAAVVCEHLEPGVHGLVRRADMLQ
jgi:hypothetical protein